MRDPERSGKLRLLLVAAGAVALWKAAALALLFGSPEATAGSLAVETLLLHFALIFPRRLALAGRRYLVRLLYAPIIAAALLMAARLLSPAGSGIRAGAQSARPTPGT